MQVRLSIPRIVSVFAAGVLFAGLGPSSKGQDSEESSSRSPGAPFEMRLNKGVPITNNRDVVVELRPTTTNFSLVESMKVGLRSDLSDGDWGPLNPRVTVQIQGDDGNKTIYGQLKDKAGNLSEILSRSITYDTKPPDNGSIQINDSSQFTNSKTGKVKLGLQSDDVFKMQVSNSEYFDDSKWERYTRERMWILPAKQDGQKVVYARFADRVDNISEPVSAAITLDTTPPSGSIQINEDAVYAYSTNVKLKITCEDPDLVEVRIVGPESQTVPVSQQLSSPLIFDWQLDTLDGKKFVRVYFKDRAGNISPEPAVDFVILDTHGPEKPYLVIDNGGKFTTNETGKVSLKIRTRETPIGITMRISNNADLSENQDFKYQPEITEWALESQQDGYQTVYLQFIDAAGNESDVSKATITLDRNPPIARSITLNEGEEWATKSVANVHLEADGADFMQVSNTPNFTGARWQEYSTDLTEWILVGEEGQNKVYARFRDRAGNMSEIISDFIMLAKSPPSGRLVINKGSKVTTSQQVTVNLVYNTYAYQMMVSNDPKFEGAQWQSVQEEIADWSLVDKDGEITVYAKFQDESGQVSAVARDIIVLDRIPPKNNKIIINRNAKFATNRDKKIRILISSQEAKFMRLSQDQTFNQATWEEFRQAKEMVLEGEDGEKTIFAQFQDENGNTSEVVQDQIILDTTPPVARLLVIDEGAEWTNNGEKLVHLKLNADEAEMMRVSMDATFKDVKWQPYGSSIANYQLSGEDGPKKIFADFKDEAGNISKVIFAEIKLKKSF